MRNWLQSLFVITLVASQAWALDPTRPANSYIRTDFTLEDGLPSSFVNAIVQTQDGFLWIGTNSGLARFNGKRFTPIYFRGPQSSPQGVVRALALAPDGDLWVGTGTGLARLPKEALAIFDRSLATFYHPGVDKSDQVNCLHFNRDGSLWIGTDAGLFHLVGSRFRTVLPQIYVSRLEESLDGHMLVTSSDGSFELDHERVVEHLELPKKLEVPAKDIFHVFEDHAGTRWICTKEGVFRKIGDTVTVVGPHNARASPAFRVIEDRQNNLWVFTTVGLFRVSSTGLEAVATHFNAATAFTDRDGTLWIGRKGDGLVRFKDRSVQMIDPVDLLGHVTVPMTVFSDRQGRLWVGNSCGGLSLFDGSKFRTYEERDGLSNSCVYALAEDAYDNLWVGTWGGGLFKFSHGKFTDYTAQQGLPDNVVRAIATSPDGSIWIATDDGLSHLENGKFRNFTTADGLSSNRVNNVFRDRRGRIWAATSEGINRMAGERFVAVRSTPRIFDKDHIGIAEDAAGNLYALSAPKGISRIKDTVAGIDTSIELLNMLDVPGQDLWLAGANGIFRLPEHEIDRDRHEGDAPFDFNRFGRADGLRSSQCSPGVPNMTIAPNGKLWVATTQGLAVLDLAKLRRTNRGAAAYVDEITIGNRKRPAERELLLPPGTHHLELHFDSIELSSPEKIRFQYRLDEVDSAWLDADTTQSAVYNSVPIGAHAFHVRACNRDGVWDTEGIVYGVTQQPFFYEALWFKACSAAAFALLLFGVYRLRVRQIGHEYNMRLDERVSERTRIARELHDTLLQSFHGLMLRFQAVQNMLPQGHARRTLENAIDHAAEAITEGRDAVQKLRNTRIGSNDLVQALRTLDQELVAFPANGQAGYQTNYCVLVEGTPRHVHPTVRDDLYRIAREAVRNALCHARARQIEVDIRYDRRILRLRVRDDGIGMDPKLLAEGRLDGHWGLPGMRERAESIGGKLGVWSELRQGTEVEVTIPGTVAYRGSRAEEADE